MTEQIRSWQLGSKAISECLDVVIGLCAVGYDEINGHALAIKAWFDYPDFDHHVGMVLFVFGLIARLGLEDFGSLPMIIAMQPFFLQFQLLITVFVRKMSRSIL